MGKKGLLDDLVADETILAPKDEEIFTTQELSGAALRTNKATLPAHIKRSHKTEEDEWNFSILTAAKDRLALKVGSKEKAQQKRNRLYNARTYLRYAERLRLDEPIYTGPLDDWTLMLKEKDGVWYVVALNIKLDEVWE